MSQVQVYIMKKADWGSIFSWIGAQIGRRTQVDSPSREIDDSSDDQLPSLVLKHNNTDTTTATGSSI